MGLCQSKIPRLLSKGKIIMGVKLILLGFFVYSIFVGNTILKGPVKNTIYVIVLGTFFTLSQFTPWPAWGIIAVIASSEIFLYFYSEDLLVEFWFRPLLAGGWIFLMATLAPNSALYNDVVAVVGITQILFMQLSYKRGYLSIWNTSIVTSINLLLVTISLYLTINGGAIFKDEHLVHSSQMLLLAIAVAIFMLLELTLSGYEKGFRLTTKELREHMLSQQYHEIQAIYLNMRGWRHDYHNHIQVLKATLDQNQPEKARTYLDGIEEALRKVDTYVKSGNVMADAILNSKLTLAEQHKINITCDAFLPDTLFISDLDLCTILGNLLDNAIESCEKLLPDKRFMRIYLAMQKNQLYLSIQNASVEEIGFKQQHFISTKMGSHGLGIKRVATVVSKWNGYISFNQEPGVFASEITIPTP